MVPRAYDALAAAWRGGIADASGFVALPYRDGVPTILTKLPHAHPPDGLAALAAIRQHGGGDRRRGGDRQRASPASMASTSSLRRRAGPALDHLLADGAIEAGASVVGLACRSGLRETFALEQREPLRMERIALVDLGAALL